MLSLHTNPAALSAQAALLRTGQAFAQSQTRLGSGYRVNSAMDDASGLQLATRLKAQSSGMAVAMGNTQNSVSMLQAADGLLGSIGDILVRIQDLAIQAADGSASGADRDALHAEYVQLSDEALQILNETPYNGEPLICYTVTDAGTMGAGPMKFQIGATAAETMTVDFRPALGRLNTSLYYAIDNGRLAGQPQDGAGTELSSAAAANALVDRIDRALADAGAVRGQIGATSNRLESVFRNLSNVRTQTVAAQGRILDVDYASESATMTMNQMLMQSGTAMLKQSNSMSQMVMALVQ
jgi:flagellin